MFYSMSEDDIRPQNENAHQTLNIFRKSAIALHRHYIASLPQKTKPSPQDPYAPLSMITSLFTSSL